MGDHTLPGRQPLSKYKALMTDDEVREALGHLHWSIGPEGRRWSADEMRAKLDVLPMKAEVMGGKLFWDDAQRVRALAALLEHLGFGYARQLWRLAGDASGNGATAEGSDLALADLNSSCGRPTHGMVIESVSPGPMSSSFPSALGRASADFGEELLGNMADQVRADADRLSAGSGGDVLDEWDSTVPVGRERFWMPAANRYPFKTLMELKRMRRGKAAEVPGSRAAKRARIKAYLQGGRPSGRRLGGLVGALRVPEDFDAPLPDEVLNSFDGGLGSGESA